MANNKLKLIAKPVRKTEEEKIIHPKDNLYKGPKIPIHFQRNAIITYSQAEIEAELDKYPGLLKTLGHAYEYQVTFTDHEQETNYWFCRNIQDSLPLLKYLHEQGWNVDWQEKPFTILEEKLHKDYP
jgi:hypothetical protein